MYRSREKLEFQMYIRYIYIGIYIVKRCHMSLKYICVDCKTLSEEVIYESLYSY